MLGSRGREGNREPRSQDNQKRVIQKWKLTLRGYFKSIKVFLELPDT